MLIILAHGDLKQANYRKYKATVGYPANSRLPKATWEEPTPKDKSINSSFRNLRVSRKVILRMKCFYKILIRM